MSDEPSAPTFDPTLKNDEDISIPADFGPYKIIREIGEGGWGFVFLAEHCELRALVALKILKPELAKIPDNIRLFKKEAQVQKQLQGCKNIVHISNIGKELSVGRDLHWIELEYIKGFTITDEQKIETELHTLAHWAAYYRGVKQSFVPEKMLKQVALDILNALDLAHRKNMTHCDVKPENILIAEEEEQCSGRIAAGYIPKFTAKLSDFGIVKVQPKGTTEHNLNITNHTMMRGIRGSIKFLSPEQGDENKEIDHRSDLYGLGATLYYCLTNRYAEGRFKLPNELYPSGSLHPRWDDLLDKALQAEPDDRWQSAAEMAQAIRLIPINEKEKRELEQQEKTQKQQSKQHEKEQARKQQQEEKQLKKEKRKFEKKAKGGRIGVVLSFILVGSAVAGIIWYALQYQEKQKLVGSKIGELREFEVASGVKIAFRWCPPTGTEGFLMGSPKDEKDRGHGETQHTVHLNNGFWMAETEFTQGQWQKSMNNNPSDYKSVGKNAPVENVSWNDVQELLKKLNASGKLPKGMKLTLPTEAQWEYACRAGTSTPFHYGSSLSSTQANFNGYYPYGGAAEGIHRRKTTPVKSFDPNAWGLYDMHGNVSEWCSNWYGSKYGEEAKIGPSEGDYCSLRGGHFYSSAWGCRSASRSGYTPSGRESVFGFRLVLQAPED